MAKKIQFKPPHGRMITPNLGEITNDNLTPELYEKLLKISPKHAELFEEVEVPAPAIKENKEKSKPNKNGDDVQA